MFHISQQIRCIDAGDTAELHAGACYVVEDVHTSLQPGWGEKPRTRHTTLEVLKRFNRTRSFESHHLTPAQQRRLEGAIASVELLVGNHPGFDQTCLITTAEVGAATTTRHNKAKAP